ncbi:hypothetical protein C8P68_108104 [Mucilaginibacter yixingensis]|uniref:Uncharacterized protein n=1 Tax=Mucilaginibacter yixingensis TaxID=1295612 RepID=A0A2T5J625_9SPHI|nr:hypothetical protein [Mucilaginibacter yixingensis]PTQ93642.1 hypothetical protein C8P68_108104 [Mucilaginibacter yixingensis]
MKKLLPILFLFATISNAFAQHSDERSRLQSLKMYEDSLIHLGKRIVEDNNELERQNANYNFIKTLTSALKVNNSFIYKFDSLKYVSILNAPDNRFRIFSWYVQYADGSYRFFGTIQMNTGGPLQMFPLKDYTPLLDKAPEDSVLTDGRWYGAQYYKIIPVYGSKPYYMLLGWKGNTVESTKKVIEVLSFQKNKPVLGMEVFNGTTKKRRVFEYTRQASMLLRFVAERNLIVFDHLAPPDKKLKDKPQTYGPDLSYDGYQLKNGKWTLIENLDMRNMPNPEDDQYIEPNKRPMGERKKILPIRKQQ